MQVGPGMPGQGDIAMTPSGYILAMSLLGGTLAGCAKDPEPAPIAPVKIEVVGHDFCDILRRINGPRGHLEWSVSDSPLSITRMRRVNAAYDARCSASSRPASAPRPSNPPTS